MTWETLCAIARHEEGIVRSKIKQGQGKALKVSCLYSYRYLQSARPFILYSHDLLDKNIVVQIYLPDLFVMDQIYRFARE